MVLSDFQCSECSVSVFQRAMPSCVLLLSPEEEEGMDTQGAHELFGSLGAAGAGSGDV